MDRRRRAPRAFYGLGCAITILGLTACSSSSSAEPARTKPILVVTTTTQLTDFAHEIGGANVRVVGLLKANVDPHDFEPTPADVDNLAKAVVIVKNGIGLEKWFEATIETAEPKGRVVDASIGVKVRTGDGKEPEDDPHIWQNPRNAKIMVANIAAALQSADPTHAATYESNLVAYVAKLDALDIEIERQIDRLPNKNLVTNHDAFGYYVDRYGLTFVGSIFPSFDTSAELSATDIQALVQEIKAAGVKAIFSESSLPTKTARAMGREARVKVVEGDDALYGDTLGPVGSDGGTYLKMMRHNTNTIVSNLS